MPKISIERIQSVRRIHINKNEISQNPLKEEIKELANEDQQNKSNSEIPPNQSNDNKISIKPLRLWLRQSLSEEYHNNNNKKNDDKNINLKKSEEIKNINENENYPVKLEINNKIVNEIITEEKETLDKIRYKVRIAFLRKVYVINFSLLLITILISCLSFIDVIKIAFENNFFALIAGIVIAVASLCFVAFKNNISREVPYNYLLLLSFTFANSIILLFLSSHFHYIKIIIVWSKIILMVFCIILMSFIFQTKFHFIFGVIILISVAIVYTTLLIIFSQIIFFQNIAETAFFLIISTLAEIILGLYLIIHSQKLINKKEEIDSDTYIIHVIQIYSDIILMFMNLLCSLVN